MGILKVATSDLPLNDFCESPKIEKSKVSRLSNFTSEEFSASGWVFWSTPQAVKTFGALHIARCPSTKHVKSSFFKNRYTFSWWNASLLYQLKMKTQIVILLQNAPSASGSIFYVVRDPCWCIGLYFA